jgi:nucleoside-diphosphate-sugar epimerase
VSKQRAVIVGCGYVGLHLARRLVEDGVDVRATTRTPERYPEIEATGAQPVFAEVMEPGTLVGLSAWEPHVVFDLVRPQPIAPERYSVWGTMNVASSFAEHPLEALVYLSSTSVYGRRGGEWTDESTEVAPSSPLGEARAESERVYQEIHHEHGFPVRICRAPGIYGPGRTLRQRLESGAYRPIDDEQLWVSRIHVDDLVEGLIAAWKRGRAGEVYLLCDDEPVTSDEYAQITAALLALPLPPAVGREEVRRDLGESAFERRVGDRRCSNRRMREELGVIPRYPSVREGLPSALRAEGAI